MKALKNKSINLYKRYTENPVLARKRRMILRLIYPIVIVVAALVVIVAMLNTGIESLNSQIEDMNAIIYDEQMAEESDKVDNLSNISSAYDTERLSLELYQKAVKSYPVINSEVYAKIFSCMSSDITIGNITYSMSDGTILFSASTQKVDSISAFVRKLRESGEYYAIVYEGYVSSGNGGEYTFVVGCQLNPVAEISDFDEYLSETEDNSVDDEKEYNDYDSDLGIEDK